MLKGIGVDIWSVTEMQRLINERAPFLEFCFTAAEREYAFGKSQAAQHLAARYAAKEAAIKALAHTNMFEALAIKGGVDYREIEVLNDAEGRPYLVFHGKFAATAKHHGVVKSLVTLSHQDETAMAFVVFEGEAIREIL